MTRVCDNPIAPEVADLATESNSELRVRAAASRSSYIPQLDALRAFAVLSVLVTHFLGDKVGWAGKINWGWTGVRLFFVISGYLITKILIEGRRLARAPGSGIAHVAGQFYARRFLRIFPIFYLTLFAAAALNLPHIRETFAWHVTYLSNVWIARHGWVLPITHLWSLAVEEQFYLFWPWFVLCMPERWLKPGCMAMIGVGVVYRMVVMKLGGWLWAPLMMPGCMDTLGMGALLAVLRTREAARPRPLSSALTLGALAGLALYVLGKFAEVRGGRVGGVASAVSDLWLALIFVWMVNCTIVGVGGPVGRVLLARPLLYMGRISYGIYVLHLFVQAAFEKTGALGRYCQSGHHWVHFIVYSVVTLAVAAASWRWFERPINDLKRHFSYGRGG
jgi:peptidoglycan/LPS O-acetylase OafA/YrhL